LGGYWQAFGVCRIGRLPDRDQEKAQPPSQRGGPVRPIRPVSGFDRIPGRRDADMTADIITLADSHALMPFRRPIR